VERRRGEGKALSKELRNFSEISKRGSDLFGAKMGRVARTKGEKREDEISSTLGKGLSP